MEALKEGLARELRKQKVSKGVHKRLWTGAGVSNSGFQLCLKRICSCSEAWPQSLHLFMLTFLRRPGWRLSGQSVRHGQQSRPVRLRRAP